MLRRLPVGDFEEISAEEMEQIDWKNLDEDGVVMYSVCVDLDYDQSLRECHCQFPCAPERRSVPVEWHSPLQQHMAQDSRLTSVQLNQT